MNNKTVHIIGAGGPAGVGLSLCIKEHYQVTGEDDAIWAREMMEVPLGERGNADMIISPPDSMINLNSICAPQEQLNICKDKSKTAELLGSSLASKTYWLRDTQGAGGAGAQMITDYLPGKNYSQEFVYFQGKLLATFQKLRVSYSVKSRTQGIENKGSSAVTICTNNNTVSLTAQLSLEKLPSILHGFYGVDLKEDENGNPRVTEINAGRLLTASYPYFYLTGYNLPLIGVKAYFKEELPPLADYPEGWGQIRQVAQLPKLFPPEVTKYWV